MQGIKYVSFYDRSGSGYSAAAKRYILGLAQLGVPVTWTPTSPIARGPLPYQPIAADDVEDLELRRFCYREVPYDTVVVHMVPEYFPQWVEREPGKRVVGYTVWETDRLPAHWPKCLNAVDSLLVPCAWNKQVFEEGGVRVPIHVVPHALEPQGPADADFGVEVGSDTCVFYTIGTWSPRKGIAQLLEAYLSAFTRADRVVLILKLNKWDMTSLFLPIVRRFLHTTARSLRWTLKRYPEPARVELIDGRLSDAQIRGLHARGDCFVSLCRAEGWGMGAFDACSQGNPVIITGHGGQLEYLPEEAAYLVDYSLIPVDVRVGQRSYSPDQKWAEPDVAHAATLMRQVVENREDARRRGAALRNFVTSRFDRETVARQLLAALGVSG